ncbi:MAG: holo-ACP synthase [Spirochaetales bacterium]|nr:MAG: holo-ACP synthase [Spirochaetales bacterium]
MILGIGIDMVEIRRIRKWMAAPGLIERYFSENEITWCSKRGKDSALSLAARFAVKEALGKALGTGMKGLALKDTQVDNDEHGKPVIILSGTAKELVEAMGGNHVHVSLTHEKEHAVAVVIIEGVDKP